MNYYLGGYYLIKLHPITYGMDKGNIVYTCSDCINNNLVNTWSYSWTTQYDEQADLVKESLGISKEGITDIRAWVDNKHDENKLGWINVFMDIETALEYKNAFFSHLNDIKLMALYFDEDECNALVKEFKPQLESNGDIGLRQTVLKKIAEDQNEPFLGYDYIGIELAGDFHTFHCHGLAKEFSEKFNLSLNKYGLFENNYNSQLVLDYLNDEDNGYEPVPWFIAKIKLVENK
jgi:hypothetical protein